MTAGRNGCLVDGLYLKPRAVALCRSNGGVLRVVVVFFGRDGIGPRVLTSNAAEKIDLVVSVEESRQFIVMKCLQCLVAMHTSKSHCGQASVYICRLVI